MKDIEQNDDLQVKSNTTIAHFIRLAGLKHKLTIPCNSFEVSSEKPSVTPMPAKF